MKVIIEAIERQAEQVAERCRERIARDIRAAGLPVESAADELFVRGRGLGRRMVDDVDLRLAMGGRT